LVLLTTFDRAKCTANPGKYRDLRYEFSENTGNSNLRVHLENHHEGEYVKLCIKNGWKNQLPKHKAQEELKLSRQGTLDGVAQAGVTNRERFSRQALLRYIVNFIVADDQVCLFCTLFNGAN
jgi:hypothetical protein